MSITIEKDNRKACPAKAVQCSIDGFEHRVFLNPMPNTKGFTSAFWNLKTVDKVKDANMELQEVSYPIKMPSAAKKNQSQT